MRRRFRPLILLVLVVFFAELLWMAYQDRHAIRARVEQTVSAPKVVRDQQFQTLINPPQGYVLTVPAGMEIDLRQPSAFVRIASAQLDLKVSREQSPYPDIAGYLKDYPNRFLAWPDYESYRKLNRIEILRSEWVMINGCKAWVIRYRRTPAPGSTVTQTEYETVNILTGGREFYTLTFRTDSLEAQRATIDQILASFGKVRTAGKVEDTLAFRPELPQWNDETRALYLELEGTKHVKWGVFYPRALHVADNYGKILALEQKLDFNFPILMGYMYLDEAFPMEGMRRAYANGQIVELTVQVVHGNNDNLPRPNANFDLLDGLADGQIRKLAREIKDFGHPILFRLNNEMNTDWSQYSGVLTLNDPDIYVANWRRMYRIFQEEGVTNAIWIFNPHDRSYPPLNWNSHLSFYPGNGFVQMLGITGYNNGTGLHDVTGETWRSFREIYHPMAEEYRPYYREFPWIITEFASSSIGGDKKAWIEEMFRELPRIPEIKAAVWFNYGDHDYRPGREQEWARPYFLDEKLEYLEAFRKGVKR